MSIDTVTTVARMKAMVDAGHSYKEISSFLMKENQGVRGLSVASVRRFCKANGINRNNNMSEDQLLNVVTVAAAEVSFT